MPQDPTQSEIGSKELFRQLRQANPDFNDDSDEVMMRFLNEVDPDAAKTVQATDRRLGDIQAAKAQKRAEEGSSFANQVLSNPFGGVGNLWKEHPIAANIGRSVTGTFPAIGAIAGSPAGGLPGSALGAGVGRGAQDLINEALGLQHTTPLGKATNIGMDTGLTAVTPGLVTAAMTPRETLRDLFGSTGEYGVFPRLLKYVKPPIFDKLFENPNLTMEEARALYPQQSFESPNMPKGVGRYRMMTNTPYEPEVPMKQGVPEDADFYEVGGKLEKRVPVRTGSVVEPEGLSGSRELAKTNTGVPSIRPEQRPMTEPIRISTKPTYPIQPPARVGSAPYYGGPSGGSGQVTQEPLTLETANKLNPIQPSKSVITVEGQPVAGTRIRVGTSESGTNYPWETSRVAKQPRIDKILKAIEEAKKKKE